jgi:hypothetical protein
MRAVLTPDDLKRGDLAGTGWHPMEILEYEEKPAETDGSTNCLFMFKILDGPSKGIVARKLFNEKALGFGKSLWATLIGPADSAKGYELTTEMFQSFVGKKLMGYIKIGKSNKGNEFNDLSDFRPLS